MWSRLHLLPEERQQQQAQPRIRRHLRGSQAAALFPGNSTKTWPNPERLARLVQLVEPAPAGWPIEGDMMHIRFICSLLLAGGMLFLSTSSFAQVGVAVTIAPPELPAYEQPMCPGDGYIWTPGFWAWDGEYYWVPGTWVMAPEVGYLWTPGYWGWGGSGFLFNDGYWGLGVGFYGGVNYGFGYFGNGYEGGRWENGHFFYNSAANRLDANSIHNVYNTRVNENVNRVSYNGGEGGINARATSEEEAVAHGRHISAVSAQTQHA